MTREAMTQWGVQLDAEGSMDFYDSEAEALESARGCPVWKVTYEPLDVSEPHECASCPTCGVHDGRHDKCCGCYDGVCCQESEPEPMPTEEQIEAEYRRRWGHYWWTEYGRAEVIASLTAEPS